MAGRSTGVDIASPLRHATEGHDQATVSDDIAPGDGVRDEVRVGCQDAREDDLGRARAVAVDGADVAAHDVQKPVHQALRVVDAPGTAPPVGATEDRLRPVLAVDAPELRSDEIEGLIPGHLHEVVPPPTPVGAWPILQPAAPEGRPCHPRVRVGGSLEIGQQRCGVRIGRVGPDPHGAVLDASQERAPVRGVRVLVVGSIHVAPVVPLGSHHDAVPDRARQAAG